MFATITLMLTNIGKLNSKESTKAYFESIADRRQLWNRRNRFYHRSLENYFTFIVPPGSSVLEVGCGAGDLLAAVKPAYGVGIDISEKMIDIAASRFPDLHFRQHDIENNTLIPGLDTSKQLFDYIILSDLLHILWDVQKALNNLRKFCHPSTRIVISNYNFLWEPVMKLGEHLRLKQPNPNSNWLSHHDIINLLEIEGFSLLTNYRKILLPIYIPIFNALFNRFFINLPLINGLGLVNFVIARPSVQYSGDFSVSIIIPARNEKGNIENAILRIPEMGSHTEIVFVEGNSTDSTLDEIKRVTASFSGLKDIKYFIQPGKGKADAVRMGFENASCDILMILDADLTVPPEDLPRFYNALVTGKGDFANGVRLVYPMEKEAMRFFNLLGNKFFSLAFSWLLGQPVKDTLCGTKVLWKVDYERIAANRAYFGDFDPFGDFDLLFGAARLNLKIVEVVVRYKERTYGSTQISRFKHGWLLLKMSMFAAVKIKFN